MVGFNSIEIQIEVSRKLKEQNEKLTQENADLYNLLLGYQSFLKKIKDANTENIDRLETLGRKFQKL
jgi:hypothetical protein